MEGIGVDGIHCVSGTCDLCGDTCDANTQELNVLTCTFKNCQDLPYHQDCLEKYLKSIRLERNRKTGFKCPRGCGKGSAHKEPCPGKIDKSHPIHPRNEEQKKKKKAKLPEVMAAPAARTVKTKEEKKQEKAAAAAAAAAAEKASAGKAMVGSLKAAPPAAASGSSSTTARVRQQPPPDPKAKLAEAVAAARRELAASSSRSRDSTPPQVHAPAAPAAPEYKTLDMYYRENAAVSSSSSLGSAATAPPPVNAWASKPPPAPATPSGPAGAAAADRGKAKPQEPSRLHVAHSAPALQPLHSPQQSSRAASPSALQLPVPPPPPPPLHPHPHQQQQHLVADPSQQQQQQVAGAMNLQHQASSASLQSGSSLPGQPLVGAEYVEDGEAPQLTKAQRKNLKRAEKKKKGGHADGVFGTATGAAAGSDSAAGAPADVAGSSGAAAGDGAAGSSGGGAVGSSAAAAAVAAPAVALDDADADALGLLYELAVQALLANKTLSLVASLQRLGFAEWQAAAAVQRNGSDLEEAVAWLLEGCAGSSAEAAAAASSGCVADVSIAEELALLEALAAALPAVPRSKVYQAVADAGGDLDAAAAVCLQQSAAAEAKDAVAAAVEDAEAVAAAEYSSHTAHQPLQQQQLTSVGTSVLDSSSTFANAPSIYNAAAAAAAAPAGVGILGSQDAAYSSWLGDNSGSISGITMNGIASLGSQQLVGSSSYGGLASPTVSDAAAASFLQAGASAAAAAGSSGLGASSSIWATGEQAGNNGSLWGSGGVGAGSGSLFSGLGLGVGTSGLGLSGAQQPLIAADPVLSLFGTAAAGSSGSVFGSTSVHDAAAASGGAGGLLGGLGADNGLQQSRLFQSYGYGTSLFGNAEQQQQQQQLPQQQQQQQQQAQHQSSADDEADLEGLMATLMCH
ncbi:hypothetical protein COO60DRAFT_1706534 [Scenedesmus sp. NREL 46B-D3]|nr:hypothetical protein COO60DRAFT_1706534 [Scenedesmus sp. NREL 46B-D3]